MALLLLLGVLVLRSVEHPWKGTTARRLAKGQQLLADDYLRIFGYWTGVVNAVVLAILLVTSRWWWKLGGNGLPTGIEHIGVLPDNHRSAIPRWSRVAVLMIVVVAGMIRLPQLERYIMRDEQDSLRYSIHGYHELDKDTGQPVFRRVTWLEAFLGNRMGNNPLLLSVTSKASLELWQKFAGQAEDRFSPVAIRMPVFLAGMASIVAIWWATGLITSNSAGWPAVFAAFLAAVHPLHIEYSVEARGYAFVLLGAAIAMGCAVNALRYGRWRDWLGLGFGFFIILYAFLGAVFFVSTLVVMIVAVLIQQLWKGERHSARVALVRFALVGVVTVGIYAQLSAPATVQMLKNEALASFRNELGPDWQFAAYTEVTSGALFLETITLMRDTNGLSSVAVMFDWMAHHEPVYTLLVFVVMLVLFLLGIGASWRGGDATRLVVCATLASALLMFCHHRFVSHRVLMVWYLIFALPVLIMLIAEGLAATGTWLAQRFERTNARYGAVLIPLLAAAFFSLFVWQTGPWYYSRNPQSRAQIYPYVNYVRGSRNWVVYPSGHNVSIPVGEDIPDQFPWQTPVKRIVDGVFGKGKLRGDLTNRNQAKPS